MVCNSKQPRGPVEGVGDIEGKMGEGQRPVSFSSSCVCPCRSWDRNSGMYTAPSYHHKSFTYYADLRGFG